MKKTNIFLLAILLLFFNSCNVPPIEKRFSAGEFPLILTESLGFENIQRVVFSDSWAVIQTPGKLSAIDLDTKKIIWSIEPIAPAINSEFVISNDKLIFASRDKIMIINREGEKIPINLSPDRKQLIELAAVYFDYVYVIRGGDWILETYDISSNAMLWQKRVGRGYTSVFYSEDDNISYIVTASSVFAISNSTGKLLWEQERKILCSTFDENVLYVLEQGRANNKISAISTETQQINWEVIVSMEPGGKTYQMTILDNLLVLSTRKGLVALDKNSGKVIWQGITDDIFYTHPVLVNNIVYARGSSEIIYAISNMSGEVLGYSDFSKNAVPSAYKGVTQIYKIPDGIVVNTYTEILIYKTR